MSIDTIGSRAARAAHHAAAPATRNRPRRRHPPQSSAGPDQRVAAGAVIVALLAGIGITVPCSRTTRMTRPTLSDSRIANLRIPIEAELPDGFRLVVTTRGHSASMPMPTSLRTALGRILHRPARRGHRPGDAGGAPLPDDLATGCARPHQRRPGRADCRGSRAAGPAVRRPAEVHYGRPCYTVDGEPVGCAATPCTAIRVTLLDVGGMPVFVSGGCAPTVLAATATGTPGDRHDAFLGSIHVR